MTLSSNMPADAANPDSLQFEVIVPVRPGQSEQYPIDASRHNVRQRTIACSDGKLFAALYSDDLDAEGVTQLQREGGKAIARIAAETTDMRYREKNQGTDVPRSPGHGEVLRIGYLSGDLKKHPVGYFLRQILAHHHCTKFEITCYDIGAAHDDFTTSLKQTSQHWCHARQMTDAELQTIRSDNIDILVDLCGHSSGNRATVITQRAAPVQAT